MAEMIVEPLEHRWEVDEGEVRRHEKRRGRRYAFERLVPRHTALVVIDLAPFFVVGSGFVRGVIPPINATARLLRTLGGTVAWVVPAPVAPSPLDEDFYGLEVAKIYGQSGGVGPVRDRLWHELDVGADDVIAEKTASSAFFPGRCKLHDELLARQVDSVLIAGTVANVCCESSVRDARTLGYRVVMLADANAAPTDEMLNATLRTVYRSFGDVRPSGEVQRLLGIGSPAQ
jgi:nicotinamidase-related amidase